MCVARYRVTIFGKDYDAMANLVRVHHIDVFRHTVQRLHKEGGYRVDAFLDEEQIRALEVKGYRIERREDLERVAKLRMAEVGRGNRYTRGPS